MKGKITLLVIAMLLSIGTAVGYDASTPYQVTVNYIVPQDSTFTVTLAGAESTVDFNPANKNSQDVEPDSQNAGASTPIATINNAGNAAQTFGVNLTAAQYAWVAVELSNFSNYATPITISNTVQTPTGWSSVAAGADIVAYMRADFTNAPGGTNAKTLRVNSSIS